MKLGNTDKILDTHDKIYWRVYIAWNPCQIKWRVSWYLTEATKYQIKK